MSLLGTAAAGLVVAVACSREARHQVLVFFYDGVPPLHAAPPDLGIGLPDVSVDAAIAPPARADVRKRFYSHPAYLANRCGGCHDIEGGGLLKTVRLGLCQMCHPEKPAKKKFVHGPVAVNGCLACHRYHKSLHPGVLVTDAQSLCYRCHVTKELMIDEHHATIEEERCIDCHDAHGGDDRYFLLPKAKTVGFS
ncbi:MAG: cytochrome c3 family protein [Planctomycetota bacterium]